MSTLDDTGALLWCEWERWMRTLSLRDGCTHDDLIDAVRCRLGSFQILFREGKTRPAPDHIRNENGDVLEFGDAEALYRPKAKKLMDRRRHLKTRKGQDAEHDAIIDAQLADIDFALNCQLIAPMQKHTNLIVGAVEAILRPLHVYTTINLSKTQGSKACHHVAYAIIVTDSGRMNVPRTLVGVGFSIDNGLINDISRHVGKAIERIAAPFAD